MGHMGIGKDKGKGKDSFGDLIVCVATFFFWKIDTKILKEV